jgi:hypothetical protein
MTHSQLSVICVQYSTFSLSWFGFLINQKPSISRRQAKSCHHGG